MTQPSFSREELIQRATLAPEDIVQINQCRGNSNQFGFAYQLGFVRLLNRFPAQKPLEIAPDLLLFIENQLNEDSAIIQQYEKRQQTISEHRLKIRDYLKKRDFTELETRLVKDFIFEEACRLARVDALFCQAKEFLREQGILEPASRLLLQITKEQRKLAQQHIFGKIIEAMPVGMVEKLEVLIDVPSGRVSDFQYLKEPAARPSSDAIVALTEKLKHIQSIGILAVNLTWLNNNYQRNLALYVKRCSADRLKLISSSRRYAALICFLKQTFHETIDQLIDTFDKLVGKICKHAENDLNKDLTSHRQVVQQALSMFQEMGQIILDESLKDKEIRSSLFKKVSKTALLAQLKDLEMWPGGKSGHMFEGVLKRFGYIRKFFPVFLEVLNFEENGCDDSLVDGISFIKGLGKDRERNLPETISTDFVPGRFHRWLYDAGSVSRRTFECALLLVIRDEIKAGNLCITHSKRFGRFDNFFIPTMKWEPMRESFFREAELPQNSKEAIAFLKSRLANSYDRFLETLPGNAYAKIEGDAWKLSIDPGENLGEKDAFNLTILKQWLSKNMRSIRLPELLIEVDNKLHFSKCFLAPTLQEGRPPEEICSLLISIMAYGCNIGPFTMARLTTGTSYEQIRRITDWQLTPENQKAALSVVVNAITDLDASRIWGDGTSSSSDGQRFYMPRKTLQQTYSPKLSDYALEFYSFVADNYAPFYSVPIECTERDAAFVLDGLLYNESDLISMEHYTDTHGYTEINFAAFAMLGRKFAPRIRGIQHQRLYRIDPTRSYDALDPMVTKKDHTINTDPIENDWNRMGHFYASLKTGHVTASVALKRLVSLSKKNHFYQANRELGRIFKTEFILEYLSKPSLRRRIRQGLLKGEQLHSLARQVFYGKRGKIYSRDLEEQMSTCSCLTLILACIIYWQAREIARVTSGGNQDAAGNDLDFSLLEHVSPIEWDNVVLYGEYVVDRNLIK